MAAAIARAAIAGRGWGQVEVASAGVAAAAGSPASEPVATVLGEHGIPFGDHVARDLTPELVDWADSILVMSSSHIFPVEEMGGGDKVALVTDFLDGGEAGHPVTDPIGGDVTVYRHTRDQLVRAVEAVLDHLEPILAP